MMSYSNLQLVTIKSINESENNMLHTFTVCKCCIKRVGCKRRN